MNRALSQLSTEELEGVLLAHARADAAPSGARERVLAGVSAAALWSSVASASSASSPSSAAKVVTWLATKWFLVGLGSGLITLTAVQAVSDRNTPSALGTERAPRVGATSALAPRARAAALIETDPLPLAPSSTPPSLGAASALAMTGAPIAADRLSGSDGRVLAESTVPAALPSAPSIPRGSVAAPVVTDGSPLAREVSALESARAALTHQAAAHALRLLNDYAREFPNGALCVEASELRLETIAELGDIVGALQLAETFLKRNPDSPLAGRVRARAESYRRQLRNP
ncbi:MAG: hypothetical protein ABW061_26885 [Polyangiaceae bacterium]